MDPLRGIHHAALTVTDLDASARWYRDVLALEDVFTENAGDRRAAILRIPPAGPLIGLVEHRPAGGSFDARNVGLDHLAMTVSTRLELETWARRLTDHGIEHSGVIEVPPGAILNFRDPDGIALALFWDRE